MSRKFLEESEYRQVREYCERVDSRDTTLVWLLLQTGMRQGELAHVRHTDLDSQTMSVAVKALKGSTPRQAPLCPELYARAARLVKGHKTIGDAISEGSPDSALRQIRRIWERVLIDVLGSCPVSAHGARHTYGVRICEATNRDVLTVKAAMGHKSLVSTQAYLDMIDSRDVHKTIRKVMG